jgi:hypothetical protein
VRIRIFGRRAVSPHRKNEGRFGFDTQALHCALQLGGNEAQRDAFLYEAVAELIIFDRALTASEQFGITSYLKEKFLF